MAAEIFNTEHQPEPQTSEALVEPAETGEMVLLASLQALRTATWQNRAACKNEDPVRFFPENGKVGRKTREICNGCEVEAECLEFALQFTEQHGVWGGLTELERIRIKKRDRDEVQEHGTEVVSHSSTTTNQEPPQTIYTRMSPATHPADIPEHRGLPLTPIRSQLRSPRTVSRISEARKLQPKFPRPLHQDDPIADARYFPSEQEFLDMVNQPNTGNSTEEESTGEVISVPGESAYDPQRVAWLYETVNRTAQTSLLDLKMSEDGEPMINADEIDQLLKVLALMGRNREVGNTQARRLRAYLQGQTFAEIAENEGTTVLRMYSFKAGIAQNVARILIDKPTALTENLSRDYPRFLEPIIGSISLRQQIVLQRYDDEGIPVESMETTARKLGMTKAQVIGIEQGIWRRFSEYRPARPEGKPVYRDKLPIGEAIFSVTKGQADILEHLYNPDGTQKASVGEAARALGIDPERVLAERWKALGTVSENDHETVHIGAINLDLPERQAAILEHLYNPDGTQRMSVSEAARRLHIGKNRVMAVRQQVLGKMDI